MPNRRVWWRIALSILLALVSALPLPVPSRAATSTTADPRDFYGMVIRDPWYEFNTDPERYPLQVNWTFVDTMLAGVADVGARWIRFEFHAEYDQPQGSGWIDWAKYDPLVNQLAPKYGFRLLALLSSGILADVDPSYHFFHINDAPDTSGRNAYTRAFVSRAKEIVDHAGDAISAYEIINEPNANLILHQETAGATKAVDPVIYGQLMVDLYQTVKPAHPTVQLVLGGMLVEQEDPTGYLTWFQAVVQSPAVQSFRAQHGHNPWDAIAIHPYSLANFSAASVLAAVQQLHSLQQQYGDTAPIWVTEVGMPADAPYWNDIKIMDPTPSELAQANFLRDVYTGLHQWPYVAHVFWFKYEDFGEGDQEAHWGLVHLRDSMLHYAREATPWPRKVAYFVYQSLANPSAVPTAPVPPPTNPEPDVRYFPETGHTVRGPFLQYWQQHGGLAQFGYPKTEVFFVAGRAVQYFERARFEYWPEFRGTPWEVQLGFLGRYALQGRVFPRQPAPDPNLPPDPNRRYFPETGQYVQGPFLKYWDAHGGLAIFGLPISGEIQEINPVDGKVYTVQYFERARLEYHPEFAGTENEIELGLLGNQVLRTLSWYR